MSSENSIRDTGLNLPGVADHQQNYEGGMVMDYAPRKSGGLLWGLLLGLAGFGTVIWSVQFSLVQPDERMLKVFLLVPAYLFAGVYLYLLLGAAILHYQVGDNGVTIRWATRTIHLPWPELTRIIRVTGEKNLAGLTGISWPGYIVGNYNLKGLSLVKMYGTRVKDDLIVLESSRGYFGLTPSDQAGFLEDLARRSNLPVEVLDMSDLSEEVRGKSVTQDMIYMGLYALNMVFLAGLIAYQAIFFPGSGASRTVVLLIALGIGVLVFNIGNAGRVYQFMPSAAYLIWGLSLLIMLTFLVLSIVTISF